MLHTHEREVLPPKGDAVAIMPQPEQGAGRFSLSRLAKQEKLRSAMALVTCLGSLALASPAGSSRQAISLEKVGFNSNDMWAADAATAERAAADVADSGASQVRLIIPYTQGGAEVKNDLERTCNAARAAYTQGLDLMITLQGYYRKDGKLGFMPTVVSDKQKYVTAVSNLMWSLAGDKNPDGSGGCVPEQKNLTIGFFNEPNNKSFNINQHVKGRWVAPENTAELMSYAYPRLKTEAAKPGLGVELTLVGGEVSTSKSSNAVGFIRQMGRYIKQQRITGPLMDKFAAHYYLQGADADPSVTAAESIRRIRTEVSSSFGVNMPVIYNEVGAWAETPKHKERLYKNQLPGTIIPLSGMDQGTFYRKFMQEAACQGVESVLIFHKNDDGEGIYRTGIDYPDGTPKPSATIVSRAFTEFSSGGSYCK